MTELWASTDHRLNDLRAAVEAWFNAKMDRVSGEYRRLVTVILLLIGFVVAVGLNVDSITVAQVLWRDPALRSAVVNAAEQAHLGAAQTVTATLAAGSSPVSPTTTTAMVPATATAEDCASFATSTAGVAQALTCLDRLDLPIGWSRAPGDPAHVRVGLTSNFFLHIIGWLITAIAVSLGAPFWFNLMGGLLRLAGDPPASPPPTGGSGGGGAGSTPTQPPVVVNVPPAGNAPKPGG